MKHIGILAHSAEGSALCYLAACHEASQRLGPHMHPDITLDVSAMGETMTAWEENDLKFLREFFMKNTRRLAAAGCDFFICPDNTAHLALESQGEPFPLPGLHIAGVVAEKAASEGFKTVGILGTKWTMEGPIYKEALSRQGCTSKIPPEKDMDYVDRIIFEELCNGIFREEVRRDYVRIIEKFAKDGCDAVVLGCTEIPLLIKPEDSPVPTLDSTCLLAVAAIDVALGVRAKPTWRGGPIN